MGQLRLWSLHEGPWLTTQPLPTLEELLGGPLPQLLVLLDLLVCPYAWFLSLPCPLACEGTGWGWEGSCAVTVCALVGGASHHREGCAS